MASVPDLSCYAKTTFDNKLARTTKNSVRHDDKSNSKLCEISSMQRSVEEWMTLMNSFRLYLKQFTYQKANSH